MVEFKKKEIKKRVINKIQKIIESIHVFENKTCVLMFHKVTSEQSYDYDEEYTISIENFKELILMIQNNEIKFLTPEEVLKKERGVLLTFDDAFEDVYLEVYPFLKAKSIPLLVFQTTNFINKKNYLTREEIIDMLQYDKFFLGSHTVNHLELSKLTKKDSFEEINLSKKILENNFKTNIEYFAYPYGCLSKIKIRDVLLAKKCNYKLAFGTISKNVTKNSKYFINRINVNNYNWKDILVELY